MVKGYCTVDDVRRVFQEADLSGALAESNNQLVVDQIAAVSSTVEKATKRHWYDSGGISEDDQNVIPSAAKSRDDEYGLPRHGGQVHGAAERRQLQYRKNSDALLESDPRSERRRRDRRKPKRAIRLALGDFQDDTVPAYTRVTLARRDVSSLDELLVLNESGAYDDWVASNDYDTGVGLSNRGADAWVRLNNGGISELNIDVHALDDDIPSLANAVYATIAYGTDEVPMRIRRGVAHLVAADLVLNDEFVTAIPDDGQLTNLETKTQRWGRTGVQKLGQDVVDEEILRPYREGA
jgi:hypothetical protein